MIQRWVASPLVEAEPRFRRVRGYRDLRYLVGALDGPVGALPAGVVCHTTSGLFSPLPGNQRRGLRGAHYIEALNMRGPGGDALV